MSNPETLRQRTYDSAADSIGDTPLIRLRMAASTGAEVFLKMESNNPLGSVKDRIGKAMIEAGEGEGKIAPGTRIVEPTSGNTGIALAFICAAKGYALTLAMPESMSVERRAMLRHLGAEVVLTPAELGMKGAIAKAEELYDKHAAKGTAFMPRQFDNPANPAIHEATTGPEIWNDMGGSVDVLVAGVGTGGTITGAARFLRRQNPDLAVIAVEPADSPVISGGEPGPHKIQGIGAGFIPGNLDMDLLSGAEQVTNDDAFAWARKIALAEGIMGGISSGANVCAAMRVAAKPENAGKRIVTVVCSFAERYLSTALFDPDRG